MVAVSRELLEEFLKDEKNIKKLKKCKNIKDLAGLLERWAKKKGYKIAYVDGQ